MAYSGDNISNLYEVNVLIQSRSICYYKFTKVVIKVKLV